MRLRIAVVLLLAGAQAAWAQNTPEPTVAVPPAPAIVSAPLNSSPAAPAAAATPAPPGLVQTPVPSANAVSGSDAGAQTAPAEASAPVSPDVAPSLPNIWVPAKNAELGVLNKVDGAITKLTIPVGGQAMIGDLQIAVQACETRPPDQLPDASVFLTLVDPKSGSAPLFRGWMVRSDPGATVVGDADETLRIIGCS
jgi:hypothetical protein